MNKGATQSDQLVGMAGIKVAQSQGLLRTLLGSCIGLILFDRKCKLLGLAHIVMPDSAGRGQPVGKYVDTAVPETIRQMMEVAAGSKLRLTAKIAGGANMFAHLSPSSTQSIGDSNILAVERALSIHQIPIVGRDLGGTVGRRLVANVATGEVEVFYIGKSSIQL